MVSKCTFLGILASIVIPTNVQCAILHILHNYFSQIPLVFAVPQDRKSAMCIKLICSQLKFLSSSISVGFWCHFPKNYIKTEPASKKGGSLDMYWTFISCGFDEKSETFCSLWRYSLWSSLFGGSFKELRWK